MGLFEQPIPLQSINLERGQRRLTQINAGRPAGWQADPSNTQRRIGSPGPFFTDFDSTPCAWIA